MIKALRHTQKKAQKLFYWDLLYLEISLNLSYYQQILYHKWIRVQRTLELILKIT